MNNIDNKSSTFVNSQKGEFSFLNIVLIFCVYFILKMVFSVVFSAYNWLPNNFLTRYAPSVLGSFLSFYITIKYLLTGLNFSDEVYNSKEKQNDEGIRHKKKWSNGIAVFVWSIPFINFVPIFYICINHAMSSRRENISYVGLFICGFLPLIGLVVAFLQYKKILNFGRNSIHLIPIFLSFLELFIVLILSHG